MGEEKKKHIKKEKQLKGRRNFSLNVRVISIGIGLKKN